MAFQISPGVNVSEIDLTTVVPSVLTTAGAFAGAFQWGPVNKRILVDSEITLAKTFGNPDSNTYISFFTAASFLAYGNNLQTVRVANNTTYNAQANTTGASVQIANEDVFQATYLTGNNNNQYGAFVARYPGALGNSLTVSLVDSASYSNTWNIAGVTLSQYVNGAPSTSAQASAAGSANDQVHIVVVDTAGLFSGAKNTVLEVFQYLSKGLNATDSLGNSNYYKNYVYNNSKYVYAIDPPSYSTTNATWGLPLANTNFATVSTAQTFALTNGTSATVQDADIVNGYSQFTNADAVNISLVLTGGADTTVQQYVIDNIANSRKDCVAFVSPPSSAVINQSGNEVTNITTWNTSLARSSSYTVADCGWKYMFDKYNNTYRWVPLNGDTAGLCVYTDSVRDPWFSPAGYNRGNLKNVVKLAWNPNQTQRDAIYSLGINPVVTFPSNGTILYGDKTLQAQPSAFDRINVRRLFIVLEKTIAQAAKYSLFEFNDAFTQAQFVALVTPFLRDVQGRRGIQDFKVVCDSTNNTAQVVNANQFVGDIYIKPARSINFIQLNFVAVRTGVDFTTVVGQF
jgi:Phage tail sheath protein subtilisin-like domain/Phage tail sheath C-terminal domain